MATLGDGFPADRRRAFVEKALVPGCVVRIEVKFPEVTKQKLLVLVADDDPELCLFVVNSAINPYVASRPHLFKCQVKIETAEHNFLRRDSYLACDKILRLHRDEVIRELMRNLGEIKGCVSDDARSEILAAVKFATTLSPAEKSKILSSLSA